MVKMLFRENSRAIPFLWKITLLLQIIIWIPLSFIGFDAHHDGLILTTIEMLHDSIRNNGEWPFNQYGPFWAMPFTVLTYALPSEWIFVVIRLITVGFYLLTGFLIYHCAKIICTKRIAFLSVLIFFLSQPFVTDYGSSLVPWPSAIIMPLYVLVTILFLRIHLITEITRQVKIYSFILGSIVSGIFFSRAQVGFLLFFAVAFLFLLKHRLLEVLLFALGFLTFTLILFSTLVHFGWLSDAINDEFIFGSLYIRGDTSTYPTPYFTFIGITIFLLLLNFGKRALVFVEEKYSPKLLISVLFGSLCIVFATFSMFLNSRDIDSLAILAVISRRFWISYYLAVIIFAVFGQLRKTYNSYKSNAADNISLYARNALVVFSLIGELQLYPLFDQMHFWWGSVPAVILTVVVTKETLIDDSTFFNFRNKILGAFLIAVTLLSLIQMTGQLSKTNTRFPQDIAKYLWVSPNVSAEQEKLQEFFSDNIPVGSSVLNLCANSDVFFDNREISSASRIFVLWPNITEIASMKQSMISSEPDVVLTCSLSRIPSLQENSELVQQEILYKSIGDPQVFAILQSSPNMTWRLWKKV